MPDPLNIQVQPAGHAASVHVCACGLNYPRRFSPGPVRPDYSGTVDALIKITQMEGIAGLYRGMAPTLVMAVPSTVLYYSLYDTLRQRMERAGERRLSSDNISDSEGENIFLWFEHSLVMFWAGKQVYHNC